MKLLHVDSSSRGAASLSRRLSAQAVERWVANHAGTTVEYLDLAAEAPSHLGVESLGFRTGPDGAEFTPAQQRENEVSERLVSQFLAADVVVIGAPMYNFTIPSQLKTWIDRVVQGGRTFRYTASGPEGLAKGKTVIVVSTRGGAYAGLPVEVMDHQESYLKAVLGFVGVSDVRIVRAEGLDLGEQARARALSAADLDIRTHTSAQAANEAKAAAAA